MRRLSQAGQQAYQGDLAILRLADDAVLPDHLTPLPVEGGRLIFLRGEVTGHHHSVPAVAGVAGGTRDDVMWLTVDDLVGDVVVEHQEHAALTLAPGRYILSGQRVYDLASGEARPVLD